MTERDPRPAATPPGQPAPDAPTVAWAPPRNDVLEDATPPPAEAVRTPPRASRARWAIALLVTALVVAVGVGAVLLLTGQSAPSSTVGYAPTGGVAYGEVRLDFPGDQKQQLGQFLSRFPGFADQSTLDVKLDDVFDRVVRAASDGERDWTTEIKPWFGGELAFSLTELPPPGQPEEMRALMVISITDANAARAWFDRVTEGEPRSTTQHNGVDVVLVGRDLHQAAMAIHENRVMLVGDDESVRDAIDTGGRSGVDTEGALATALASVEGDALGYMFIDTAKYMAWFEQAARSLPEASAIPFGDLESLPDWMLFRAQARGDALALEAVWPHVEAMTAAAENRAGTLAEHVPPSTFLLIDGHDAGDLIRQAIERAREDPANAEAMRQADQLVNFVGGWDGVVGWLEDAGFALARDGDGISGGLLFTTSDRSKAERLLTTLRSFVQLGGGSMGMSARDEDHNGTTIGILDFGDFRDLAALAGGAAGLPPGAEVPEGRLEVAYATTDEFVVVGVGPSFVRASLDAGSGPSLAEDERYRSLLDRIGAENAGSAFVDIAGLRELIETLAATDPGDFAQYERDIKPYLLPLDAYVQAIVRDGELDRTTMVVTVK